MSQAQTQAIAKRAAAASAGRLVRTEAAALEALAARLEGAMAAAFRPRC